MDPESEKVLKSVLTQMERLALAGNPDEARRHLHSVWPFVRQAAGIDAEEVSLFAGMAIACRLLSLGPTCRNYANFALINNPDDALAQPLLTADEKIALVRQLLHHQQIEKARKLLGAMAAYAPTDEGAFYIALLNYFDAQKSLAKSSGQAEPSGRPTLLNIVAWGDAYIDKLFEYSLPSLLAPGNIPALADRGTVIVDIHTAAADREAFRESAVMKTLARHASVRYSVIPDALLNFHETEVTRDSDRLVVSGAQYTSAIRAKHTGADLVYVATEGIYCDSMLGWLKHRIATDCKAVATAILRTRESEIDAYLHNCSARKDSAIRIGTASLIEFSIENLNPSIFASFIRSQTRHINQDPIALFFKTAEGFSSHTFQLSAGMISNDLLPEDFSYDYHTQDARFLAEIIGGGDPEARIGFVGTPSGNVIAIDLDSGSENLDRGFGSFAVDVRTCAESAIKWCTKESDFTYFEWAFQKRMTLSCGAFTENLPDSDLNETETVAAFLEQFRALQPERRKLFQLYRGTFLSDQPARS